MEIATILFILALLLFAFICYIGFVKTRGPIENHSHLENGMDRNKVHQIPQKIPLGNIYSDRRRKFPRFDPDELRKQQMELEERNGRLMELGLRARKMIVPESDHEEFRRGSLDTLNAKRSNIQKQTFVAQMKNSGHRLIHPEEENDYGIVQEKSKKSLKESEIESASNLSPLPNRQTTFKHTFKSPSRNFDVNRRITYSDQSVKLFDSECPNHLALKTKVTPVSISPQQKKEIFHSENSPFLKYRREPIPEEKVEAEPPIPSCPKIEEAQEFSIEEELKKIKSQLYQSTSVSTFNERQPTNKNISRDLERVYKEKTTLS